MTLLPWVVTRQINGEDRPLASFAFHRDAEHYLRNPKYMGQLRIVFSAQNSVIDRPVYHAKVISPCEFLGSVIAKGFELNPKTHRYEGYVHNPHTKKILKNKLYENLPDTLLGYKVVWITGNP